MTEGPQPAPVVIVGVGRSGSTLLHRLISLHPRVAWISGLANRLPSQPWVNHVLMQAASVPGLHRAIRNRFRPSEHYLFWDAIAPGFSVPDHDLGREDLIPSVAATAPRRLLAAATRRRPLLVLKLTGWPRIGYVDALLGNPRFIHIVRDGRAVAASLVGQDWWRGRGGPSEWGLGPMPGDLRTAWEAAGRSPYLLAAIQWKIQTDAVEAARSTLASDRFLAIRYEDLCGDVGGVIGAVLAFSGLDRAPIERALGREQVRPATDGWRRGVTADEVAAATGILQPELARYGYPTGSG